MGTKDHVIQVRIDKATKAQLEASAAKENRSVSNMIRIAIQKFLKGK